MAAFFWGVVTACRGGFDKIFSKFGLGFFLGADFFSALILFWVASWDVDLSGSARSNGAASAVGCL